MNIWYRRIYKISSVGIVPSVSFFCLIDYYYFRKMFMNSAGKTVNLCFFLLFALVFGFSLYAEPLPDDDELSSDEESLLNDNLVFEAPPLIFEVPSFETRSLDDIFPGLSEDEKEDVMSSVGIRNAFEKDDPPTLIPSPDSGIDLLSSVMAKRPSHIIEALVVVPYIKRELDMLDIYNAFRRIKNIQDHTISVRGNDYKMFMDTTRLESDQKRRPIPDPPPADTLPYSETMYLRFVDLSMGDLYLRGDISISLYGITYSLTNFRDVSFSIFKIMRAERFSAILYIEPVKEGVLIYSMSGLFLPNFIAQRVHLTSNMNVRITVLLDWIIAGLRLEEERNNKYPHYEGRGMLFWR